MLTHLSRLFHWSLQILVALISSLLMSSMRWPLTRRLWRANTPARYEIQTNSNGKQVFARLQTNQTTTPSKYINKRASVKPSTTSFFHTNTSIRSPSTSTSSSSHSNPHIHRIAITIHGYLGLPRPFFLWRQSLTEAGFEVVDYAYDSGGSMETIANGLNQLLRRTIRDVSQRHPSIDEVQFNFICHSMGGLVLRAAINSGFFPIPIRGVETSQEKPASHHRLAVNRVVMIATPNQGSEYARTLAKYPTLKKVVLGFARLRIPGAKRLRGLTPIDDSKDSASIGAATTELLACGDLIMTRSPEWFRTNWTWPRVLYPRTLVIAGTLSLLQGLTPTTSDGTITFEETKLPPPPPSTIETATESDGDASTDPLPPLPNSAVSFGPCNSQHMSFHAQHSLLLTHPGVIQASVNFIQTGRPE